MKHPLKVSLEDLYNGKTAKLAVSHDKIVGAPVECKECNGKGMMVRLRQIGPGMVQQIQMQCPQCNGSGYSMKKQKERQVLEVNIDKGMRNGEKIRFRGMSDDQPNAEPGDILFILQEKDHPVFQRKNNDLLIKKEITLLEALTGYEFPVTHLDGRTIIIKSQPGEIIRPDNGSPSEPFITGVEDEGMPNAGSPFAKGRLFIYFRIVFPRQGSLSATAISALKSALPGPPPIEPYDPETTDVLHTDTVDLKDFGKKEASGGTPTTATRKGNGKGGVQCQQG